MAVIIGLSGSLRQGSYNTMLLRAAAPMMPPGVTLEIASIRDIPLYDADVDAAGQPQAVIELKDRLAAADGLLIATPEYNHSFPGVAKNAIDWLSRPIGDTRRVFGGLPVALMGATTGRGSTMLAQAAWLPVLRALGTRPWFGRLLQIPQVAGLVDENGLRDEATRKRLEKLATEFAAFVVANKR